MINRRVIWSLPALALAAMAVPASAAEEIVIADLATYTHPSSDTKFPPTLREFTRYKVVNFDSEYDIGANYAHQASGTEMTIYVTRVGTPDIGVWFDRARLGMTGREGIEPRASQLLEPEFFVAPGFSRDSGARLVYNVRKGRRYQATGVFMMAYRGHLIKIRASSTRLSADDLQAKVEAVIAEMSLPDPTGQESPPYAMRACADALVFDNDAQQLDPSAGMATTYSMLAHGVGSVVPSSDSGGPLPPTAQYCREGEEAEGSYDLYRPDGRSDGYLVAFSDAGRSLVVGSGGGTLLDIIGGATNGFPVIYQIPSGNAIFAGFSGLPDFETANDSRTEDRMIATSNRLDNITITFSDPE